MVSLPFFCLYALPVGQVAHYPLQACLRRAILRLFLRHLMDFDTDILSEIEDSDREIFDIPELRDDEFDFNSYLSGDYDY